MATGDSIVSICNIGLIGIGEDPIASFQDNTKAAILCGQRYDQIRRAILRSRDWNFARKRAQLTANTTPPAFGFGAAYPLPSDFMRFLTEDLGQMPYAAWVIEGNQILTNDESPVNLRYIYDCQDPTLFDALFVTALGEAIGANLAKPLSQSKSEADDAAARSGAAISEAATASSQENSPHAWDIDVLLISRG